MVSVNLFKKNLKDIRHFDSLVGFFGRADSSALSFINEDSVIMARSTVHYADNTTNKLLKRLHNKLRPAGTLVQRVEYSTINLMLKNNDNHDILCWHENLAVI